MARIISGRLGRGRLGGFGLGRAFTNNSVVTVFLSFTIAGGSNFKIQGGLGVVQISCLVNNDGTLPAPPDAQPLLDAPCAY